MSSVLASQTRVRTRAVLGGLFLVLLVGILEACGGDGDGPTDPPPPEPVASVTVDPASASVQAGSTMQLTASTKDANGRTLTGLTIGWTSSDESIATVSSTGLVMGVAPGGPVTITASSDGVIGTATATVVAGPNNALSCGDLVSATISSGAEVDVYAFSGQSGDRVALTLAETGGTFVFGGARPVVTLIAPDRSTVLSFGANAQQMIALPMSGTYTLRVNANDLASTGSYGMGIECVRPPVADSALVIGDNVGNTIAAGAQVDIYTITGSIGHRVALTLAEIGGTFVFGGARPVVTLIAPDTSIVTSFGANGQQTVTLPLSGTYVVKVDANDFASTGSYRLDVQSLVPPQPVDGTLVCDAPATAGSIATGADVDVYTFDGQSGRSVNIVIAETGGTFVFGGARPVATLIAPNGSVVATVHANGQTTVGLSATGQYVLKVDANDFATTGTYGVSIQCL
jgi:hypothetical protein